MNITRSLKKFDTDNESGNSQYCLFYLIPDVLNWLVSALISSNVKFRIDDAICHFTLSADDAAPQQDPKSH